MTLSQELEAARAQAKLYQGALRRIRRTCKFSEEEAAEIRDYCFFQSDNALAEGAKYRPGSPTEAGTETRTAETREAAG